MKITLSLLVVVLSLVLFSGAFAIGETPGANPSLTLTDPFGCAPESAGNPPCFVQILQNVIGRVLVVIYPILAGMVFYGGLQMMFARGNAEKYKGGLRTIQYAVIGFTVIVLAQGIGYVLHDLLSRS